MWLSINFVYFKLVEINTWKLKKRRSFKINLYNNTEQHWCEIKLKFSVTIFSNINREEWLARRVLASLSLTPFIAFPDRIMSRVLPYGVNKYSISYYHQALRPIVLCVRYVNASPPSSQCRDRAVKCRTKASLCVKKKKKEM